MIQDDAEKVGLEWRPQTIHAAGRKVMCTSASHLSHKRLGIDQDSFFSL